MARVDPGKLDLATLAALAGSSANEHLLGRIRRGGHEAVRVSHGYVFQHLIDRAPTVGELAEGLGVSQQAASKSIAELEALGYVERRSDPEDSRVRRVALTPSGRGVVERGRAARAELQATLAAKLDAKTIEHARLALVALLEATGGLEAVETRRAKPPTELRPSSIGTRSRDARPGRTRMPRSR